MKIYTLVQGFKNLCVFLLMNSKVEHSSIFYAKYSNATIQFVLQDIIEFNQSINICFEIQYANI